MPETGAGKRDIARIAGGIHCSGPRIARSIDNTVHTGMSSGAKTHHTRLKRHDKDTAAKPGTGDGRGRLAQGYNLGMADGVSVSFHSVGGPGKQTSVLRCDHSSHRGVPSACGCPSLAKGHEH